MDVSERSLVGSLPYRTVDVPVQGGSLRVGVWGTGGPVVLCAHGVTANHAQFLLFAERLGASVRLIAPDLRGRGRSNRIAGPWGMAAHAADMVAVLDHFKLPKADVLLGHSMGGFVAAVAAAQYPDRFGRVVLVDGGVPLMSAAFIAWLPFSSFIIERIVKMFIGPSLTRLEMTFESREAYRNFWRPHPALAQDWSPQIEAYLDYDLEGEPPALRPSTNKAALLLDARTQLIEDLVARSLKQIRCPVRFLRAPRGLTNAAPLYREDKLARGTAGIANYSCRTLEDVNHFTIMLSERGARAVAEEVRKLLG